MVVMTAMAGFSAFAARSAPFAAYVMDARTGETLLAQNADTRLHPASLTKMLTLYITFDAIRRGEVTLDTMVTVSANAAAQPPSRLGLRKGQKIALRHLIRAAAIKSANDAATAIGDHLGGNEAAFAARMNRTAKALGMKNSTFRNANGLTAAGHLSTARDMSILGRRLFYDFPEYYNIFSRRSTDAGVAKVVNTNSRFLDSYAGADGIKTGYTVAAGFNLTASAERGRVRLIATVFGGTSTAQRNSKIAGLLDEGFRKAPANAAVRKPAPAQIPAPEPAPPEPPLVVASAATAPMSGSVPGGVGKTIRLVTTVNRSPRPLARPGADASATAAAVAALQSTIDDAVAAAAKPEVLPFATVDAAGNTLAPAGSPAPAAAVAGAAPADLPFAVADAAGGDPAAAGGFVQPVSLPTRPQARPAALAGVAPEPAAAAPAEAPVAVAAADLPFAVVEEPEALPFAVAEEPVRPLKPAPEAATGLAALEPGAEPEPTMIATLSASAAPRMAPPPEAAGTAPAQPMLVAALRPAPKADETPAAEGEPVVLTRLSTSGGRHWGVSLGRFNSRMAAEQALMRVALSDGAVLGEGLRKVVGGARGYDANVLGLTQEQAELACRRLAARAQDCTTLGP